jgi:hypothetical protein
MIRIQRDPAIGVNTILTLTMKTGWNSNYYILLVLSHLESEWRHRMAAILMESSVSCRAATTLSTAWSVSISRLRISSSLAARLAKTLPVEYGLEKTREKLGGGV